MADGIAHRERMESGKMDGTAWMDMKKRMEPDGGAVQDGGAASSQCMHGHQSAKAEHLMGQIGQSWRRIGPKGIITGGPGGADALETVSDTGLGAGCWVLGAGSWELGAGSTAAGSGQRAAAGGLRTAGQKDHALHC